MRISRGRLSLILGASLAFAIGTIPILAIQLDREATRNLSLGVMDRRRRHCVPKHFQNRLLSLGTKRRYSGHRESNARMSTRGERGRHR
jgi:hypothetical protein